jgi:PAS domain S-box-containing protein
MRATLKQFGILAGFVLLGLLLFGNSLMTKHRLDLQVGSAQKVLEERQILSDLQQAQSTLKDAESGQRGYLLTGDPKYLEPYDRAKTQIGPLINDLASLTADNPSQQANIADLRTLAGEKMDELAQTVALYKAGHTEQAKAIVLSDRGLLLMDGLRQVFAKMGQEEIRLLSARDAEYRHDSRTMAESIWLATLVALLGLILLAHYILREHTLREKHAQELRAGEELYRTTLTSIGDAVIATDRIGNVTFLNPVAEKLTGIHLKNAYGKNIAEVFPIFNEFTGKRCDDPVKKVMELGLSVGLANHTALKNSDSTLIPIEDSAAPIRDDRGELVGVVLVFRDVTADRRGEEILRKTEKLAAAARLSATVAHEINNPLAAVVNLIYIAKNTPGTPAAVVQQLAQVEQELDRVAHITRQTLAFHRESVAPEPVEIATLVESVLKLYSNKLVSKNITVERRLEESALIRGIKGELRQAVSNLIANAIDAVEINGTIVVSGRMTSDSKDGMVEIVVADNGPGIAAKYIDRIFEPFFTTKKDVGTGLGLWAAKTIIERHGGTIRVQPRQDAESMRGALFAIQLPRIFPRADG